MRLVVIGNGKPFHIKPFRKVTGYKGELYTDSTLETFKLLNLKSGLGSLFGTQSIREGLRAYREGHSQEGIQGSALQQGGALVVGPGDLVHYLYRSREPGDHPPVPDLLAVGAG